ncbi:MAG: DUF5050 domain-containing protein [Anaerolineales bacterium]|nr:DUF5050 domain-containing protein [Anaerolineales bacterium]
MVLSSPFSTSSARRFAISACAVANPAANNAFILTLPHPADMLAIANARLFKDLSKTDKSLRESEERFRAMVEQAAVGVAQLEQLSDYVETKRRNYQLYKQNIDPIPGLGRHFSLGGDWIAFYSDCDGDRNIYKVRPDGSKRTRLTLTSGSNNWFPAWSPDGKRITFTSNRSGTYHIFVMNADGSNIRELAEGCISAFSPDGTRILFGVYCVDTDDLFLMDADGSNPTALTDGYECKNATWSPDGTQIVFQLSKTTKDGPFALYRMYLDKPDREDWVLLADFDVNGGSPAWQP